MRCSRGVPQMFRKVSQIFLRNSAIHPRKSARKNDSLLSYYDQSLTKFNLKTTWKKI